MEIPMSGGSLKLDPGRAVAAFFARTGIARLSRHWRPSDACVLTFHGVRDGSDDDQLLDLDQHITLSLFQEVCTYLAANYTVLPLSEIVDARMNGKSLPSQTVAITFDDGYDSNHLLAFPILKSLGLPATIFAAAGYLDQRITLWFHRVEMAFARTQAPHLEVDLPFGPVHLPLSNRAERSRALGTVTAHLKSLSASKMLTRLAEVETALGVTVPSAPELPPALRPMSWDTARAMQASGLIEFGGHTDTHPILSRCTDDQQGVEIRQSRVRLTDELGSPPTVFAYTNGKTGDFTPASQRMLKEEGFLAAFTMQEAFILPCDDAMALPRYGYPSSCDYLEAIVSGSMSRLESLRKNLGLVHAA